MNNEFYHKLLWGGGTQGAKVQGIRTSRRDNWASLFIKLGPAQMRQPYDKNRVKCLV